MAATTSVVYRTHVRVAPLDRRQRATEADGLLSRLLRMADPAQFGHDMLGHLLADRLMKVPRFQRRYSWQADQVQEYWADIERARGVGDDYFMGTIVPSSRPDRLKFTRAADEVPT